MCVRFIGVHVSGSGVLSYRTCRIYCRFWDLRISMGGIVQLKCETLPLKVIDPQTTEESKLKKLQKGSVLRFSDTF